MTYPAIVVQNISKRYRIDLADNSSRNTLTSTVINAVRSPMKNFRRLRQLTSFGSQEEQKDIIWALRDVSFTVLPGEVVGIMGRNGAGKSTLLKVISRITHPTSGRLELRGTVSSLLEVGTGFHPELSGRENIYLNGTILGMRRREIDRKLDEIVEFSGVEKFLDTPIKRYSSGMRVRLAFSVAAHLEPEILLVDEVLSVGDAVFQKKSMGKMKSVAKEGRTVLFVSHQMDAVRALCSRGILVADGRVVADGQTDEIVDRYMEIATQDSQDATWSGAEIFGSENRGATICSVQLQNSRGNITRDFDDGEDIHIVVTYRLEKHFNGQHISLRILDEKGSIALSTSDSNNSFAENQAPGIYTTTCSLPARVLNQSEYTVFLWCRIANGQLLTTRGKSYVSFNINGTLRANNSREPLPGILNPSLPEWQTTTAV